MEFDKLLSGLDKKYSGVVMIADDKPLLEETPRLKTGIFTLDFALGGGIPVGRITMAYGPRSGGKTALFLKTIASAQHTCRKCYSYRFRCDCKKKEGMRCVWFDVEGVWENKWAKTLGVNTKDLLLAWPETAEEVIDVGKAILKTGECDLLVIDSLARMTPSVEVEESAEKWQQGLLARLLNKMLRSWGATTT